MQFNKITIYISEYAYTKGVVIMISIDKVISKNDKSIVTTEKNHFRCYQGIYIL